MPRPHVCWGNTIASATGPQIMLSLSFTLLLRLRQCGPAFVSIFFQKPDTGVCCNIHDFPLESWSDKSPHIEKKPIFRIETKLFTSSSLGSMAKFKTITQFVANDSFQIAKRLKHFSVLFASPRSNGMSMLRKAKETFLLTEIFATLLSFRWLCLLPLLLYREWLVVSIWASTTRSF